ncbi:MAG: hypothetical protein QGD94_04285, partial [Planctomycetia bacterium]|nr:hypothetical protein [Planctomycetia bacterium]
AKHAGADRESKDNKQAEDEELSLGLEELRKKLAMQRRALPRQVLVVIRLRRLLTRVLSTNEAAPAASEKSGK